MREWFWNECVCIFYVLASKTTFLRTFLAWAASAGGLRPSSGRVLKVRALCHVDYKVYIIGIHDTLHLTVYSHSLKAWARPSRLWVRRFFCHITSLVQKYHTVFFILSIFSAILYAWDQGCNHITGTKCTSLRIKLINDRPHCILDTQCGHGPCISLI